jgi:hypothetical protein
VGIGDKLTNWAGNLEYASTSVHAARSLDDVRAFVKSQPKLKVLGTRHCFNTIADSLHGFLSLAELGEAMAVDASARTVTVAGGLRYGQLARRCTSGDSRSTISPRCRTSASRGPAARPRTARARRTATWRAPCARSSSSPPRETWCRFRPTSPTGSFKAPSSVWERSVSSRRSRSRSSPRSQCASGSTRTCRSRS